jgi:hypothetical protein
VVNQQHVLHFLLLSERSPLGRTAERERTGGKNDAGRFDRRPDGDIDWSEPGEELHRFHNQQARELGRAAVRTAAVGGDAGLGDMGRRASVGSGFPALDERIIMELVETRNFGSHVVYLRYRRT